MTRLEAAQLTRWIAEQATSSDDRETLLETFCGTLVTAGLPLWRVSVSTPAIDPTARAFSMNWVRGQGISLVRTAHGVENEAAFRRGPVHALIEAALPFARWRLDSLRPGEGYTLLHEIRQDGGTDYVLHMIGFTPGSALRGVALSSPTALRGSATPTSPASMKCFRFSGSPSASSACPTPCAKPWGLTSGRPRGLGSSMDKSCAAKGRPCRPPSFSPIFAPSRP